MDDQIALLKHKLYMIQQGLAFNGKRTKTARSQGKKFQVSVEQEATRLLVLKLNSFFLYLYVISEILSVCYLLGLIFFFFVLGELGVGIDATKQLH